MDLRALVGVADGAEVRVGRVSPTAVRRDPATSCLRPAVSDDGRRLRVVDPMTHSPAVIVLGMLRSGTTLLKEMLDHHPALAMAPESYFIPSLWRRFRVRRNARHLLGDLAALPQLRLWGVDLHDLSRRVRPDASFADVMAMVYGALAAGRERPRYGDKTTTYREDLGILERAFPGGVPARHSRWPRRRPVLPSDGHPLRQPRAPQRARGLRLALAHRDRARSPLR